MSAGSSRPQCSWAQNFPVLPPPVWTSSTWKAQPCWGQKRLTNWGMGKCQRDTYHECKWEERKEKLFSHWQKIKELEIAQESLHRNGSVEDSTHGVMPIIRPTTMDSRRSPEPDITAAGRVPTHHSDIIIGFVHPKYQVHAKWYTSGYHFTSSRLVGYSCIKLPLYYSTNTRFMKISKG